MCACGMVRIIFNFPFSIFNFAEPEVKHMARLSDPVSMLKGVGAVKATLEKYVK